MVNAQLHSRIAFPPIPIGVVRLYRFSKDQTDDKAMKVVKVILLVMVLGLVIGGSFLVFSPGLRSDLTIGLSPETHSSSGVNVRDFTTAPLRAEVKVYLPISPKEAMSIVADFDNYSSWVSPPPKRIDVDNSGSNGTFGVGSKISYREGESDIIVLYKPSAAMIAKPLWAADDFAGHHGVVIVTSHRDGSLMHMRRYFTTTSAKGWMMSKMMPRFMEKSAENLAKQYDGEVY